jgi:CBS domain-containing protein
MHPEPTVIDALRLMWDGGFHHLPLIRAGRVIGVVSHSDFKGEEFDCLETERSYWEHMR